MCRLRKIEFYISPDGNVKVDEEGVTFTREYTESDYELTDFVSGLIEKQYPQAYHALEQEYEASMLNKSFFRFLIVHRFIRCNFGKFDGLTYDIEGNVMHLEEINCPLKWRNECPLRGVVCRPLPFGLSPRETEVAKMASSGKTYDEISEELGIAHSTIKNVIQKVKEKLHLDSSKDIAKILIPTL